MRDSYRGLSCPDRGFHARRRRAFRVETVGAHSEQESSIA